MKDDCNSSEPRLISPGIDMRHNLYGLVLVAIVAVGCGSEVQTANNVGRPNIIYILADDLGYGELGAYGQQIIKTPHIDSLAADGMRFTHHYSGSPVCAPARAAFLTGQHTGSGQIKDNFELGGFHDDEENGQMPLAPGTFTLSGMLQDAGYETAVIGKWGLGGPGSVGVPSNHGFDLFFGYLDQKQAHNYYPTHLWRNEERVALNNEWMDPHQVFVGDSENPKDYEKYSGKDYAVDFMTGEALSFIEKNQDSPFFLYLAYPIPHVALQVPDASLDRYDTAIVEVGPYLGDDMYLPHPHPRRAYAAMISTMDDHIGRILALLADSGLDKNTIVVFSSDNGPTYVSGVDTEYFDSTGGLRGRKGEVYEGGIRVPFIVRWPGQVPAGETSEQVSAAWDLLPTIADILDLDIAASIDGVSILPALLDSELLERRPPLYWEYHGFWDGAQAVRDEQWKAIRLGGHLDSDSPIQLYDLTTDPQEVNDVSDDHPDVVKKLAAVMSARTVSALPEWNFAADVTQQ